MNKIPEELMADVEALMAKHNVDNLDKADFLGQIAGTMGGTHLQNTSKWLPGGMAFGYAMKHDVIGIIKRIAEKTSKPFVYNDDDCDMRGYVFDIEQDCLDCHDSLLNRIMKRKPVKTEDCTRCNGTGIDPESIDHAWVLHHWSHGHDTIYIVFENCISTKLHIRYFRYNSSKEQLKEGIEQIIEAIKFDSQSDGGEFKAISPMYAYQDGRDKGFCLSMDISKNDIRHNTETTNQGLHYLTDVVEHFVAVEEDIPVCS